MRNPRFLHVSFGTAVTNQESVSEVIASESFDWMFYAGNCYLVWSSSDCETILRKLQRVPGLEKATMFVVAVNMEDGFGYFPNWLWHWIMRDRGFGSVSVWDPDNRRPILPAPTNPLLPE